MSARRIELSRLCVFLLTLSHEDRVEVLEGLAVGLPDEAVADLVAKVGMCVATKIENGDLSRPVARLLRAKMGALMPGADA